MVMGLDGVGSLDKSEVVCDFTKDSFDLRVHNLDGRNYRCVKDNLDKDRQPMSGGSPRSFVARSPSRHGEESNRHVHHVDQVIEAVRDVENRLDLDMEKTPIQMDQFLYIVGDYGHRRCTTTKRCCRSPSMLQSQRRLHVQRCDTTLHRERWRPGFFTRAVATATALQHVVKKVICRLP